MARHWVIPGPSAAVHALGNTYESPELDVRFGHRPYVLNTPVFRALPGALEAPERVYTNAAQHIGLPPVAVYKHFGRLTAPDPY